MKLQVLNGSFGKVMTTAFVAFIVASVAVQAQGQWGSDGCFYAQTGRGQAVRQVCVTQASNGHRYYNDYTTGISRDLNTGYDYAVGQNGRLLIRTNAGWADYQATVSATYNQLQSAIQHFKTLQAQNMQATAQQPVAGIPSCGYPNRTCATVGGTAGPDTDYLGRPLNATNSAIRSYFYLLSSLGPW